MYGHHGKEKERHEDENDGHGTTHIENNERVIIKVTKSERLLKERVAEEIGSNDNYE